MYCDTFFFGDGVTHGWVSEWQTNMKNYSFRWLATQDNHTRWESAHEKAESDNVEWFWDECVQIFPLRFPLMVHESLRGASYRVLGW